MWAAMHNRPLTIYGNGTDTRDYVFVDDVVTHLLRAEPSFTPDEVGTGLTTSSDELLELIRGLTGSKSEVLRAHPRRWDHHGRPAVTSRRSCTVLSDGLRATYEWFQANYDRIAETVAQS
jgi:UDP-glucose 4-epimerase